LSNYKIESKYRKELNSKFISFKNPYYFTPANSQETAAVEFLNFMERHPPILSIPKQDDQQSCTIFNPENPGNSWLTIDRANAKDYDWFFKGSFFPVGLTHYMAVDLVALSNSRPLIEINTT
jgi:hypothetical protein